VVVFYLISGRPSSPARRFRYRCSPRSPCRSGCSTQASTGFTHTVKSPGTGVLASGAGFQTPIYQTPGFHLSDAQPADPEGHKSDPLTPPKLFLGDLLRDEKRIWKFRWEVAHGHHWKPALAFTLATAALVELDPHDTSSFRRTQSFACFNRTFTSFNTGLSEGLATLPERRCRVCWQGRRFDPDDVVTVAASGSKRLRRTGEGPARGGRACTGRRSCVIDVTSRYENNKTS
jgi:hypothetical protein